MVINVAELLKGSQSAMEEDDRDMAADNSDENDEEDQEEEQEEQEGVNASGEKADVLHLIDSSMEPSPHVSKKETEKKASKTGRSRGRVRP